MVAFSVTDTITLAADVCRRKFVNERVNLKDPVVNIRFGIVAGNSVDGHMRLSQLVITEEFAPTTAQRTEDQG